MQLRVAVVGSTGYTGFELVSLLQQHPQVQLVALTSQSYAGKPIATVFPALQGVCSLVCEPLDVETLAQKADFVFVALPHKKAMEVVAPLVSAGKRVVDLSADFRFRRASTYEQWYQEHTARELLAEAVYGLPELHGKTIRTARIVGNPGCYPTGVILAAAPLVAHGFIALDSIIADCKSGVSGAGRAATLTTHYCEANEGFKAYKVGEHRHTPEIEQELSAVAGEELRVVFTPHLVPMSRGILSTVYGRLTAEVTEAEVRQAFEQAYGRARFVRIMEGGQLPATLQVRGTNFCDIGWRLDRRTGRIIVISAIDNLTRGASGQAVCNMNLMCGFPEDSGLDLRVWQP
ncbi:MAG: N-acetyl-gamma-glutamyl-phosphate reductase [Deltaproteobacteria bacterium]|nr:N-acetyl-gamma-glutamyl-phosphate reductase [Deltaproteobacteria bacterium]MBW2069972.1 N-acetyl-gamma-glutamyl-phosphate reductase [Deltaproteobacteria bacterium]